jgi:hypothetical protein
MVLARTRANIGSIGPDGAAAADERPSR